MKRGIPAVSPPAPTAPTATAGPAPAAAPAAAAEEQLSMDFNAPKPPVAPPASPAAPKPPNPLAVATATVSEMAGESVSMTSTNWARAGNTAAGVTKGVLPEVGAAQG